MEVGQEFQDFRDSPERIDTVGAFYDLLNNDSRLIFLSSFNQPVPLVSFRGSSKFEYSYGTEMQRSGSYEDPLGRTVIEVKSIQINRQAFGFYKLDIKHGKPITWDEVDYSEDSVPILLGSLYEGVYDIGDELEGWLYFKDMRFKVIGFLEDNSAIYYKGNANHYLDDYVLIPYPQNLNPENYDDRFFYGILSFAMINGDIAVPKDMTPQEVLRYLDSNKYSSGFCEYTLLNTPSYLIQLTFMRQLLEDNLTLILTVQALITLIAMILVFLLNILLSVRRKQKTAVWLLMGDGSSRVTRYHGYFWLSEHSLAFILFLIGLIILPNKNDHSLLIVFCALLCFTAIDIFLQWVLLKRNLRAFGQKG